MPRDAQPPSSDPATESTAPGGRPFIGILFECCDVYSRIYRQPDAREYRGRCPRCMREIRLRVASDGVSSRQFRAR